MERLLDVHSVENHLQLAARRLWGDVDSPTGMIAAVLPPHNLLGIASSMDVLLTLDGHPRVVLAELRGNP